MTLYPFFLSLSIPKNRNSVFHQLQVTGCDLLRLCLHILTNPPFHRIREAACQIILQEAGRESILSFEHTDSLSFSHGSLFVLLSCVCWGFENNCTRKLSSKNPLEIVIVKGFGSGTGSLLIALIRREHLTDYSCLFPALLLGFVAYGLSILFYIYAQRGLGAAKTSTYYAVSPFIGTLLSLLLFREIPSCSFFIALLFMLAGTWLANSESVQGSE